MNSNLKNKSHIYWLSIPFLGLILLRLFGFDGLYGMDSYEYIRYSGELKEYFLTGEHPGAFFWPIGYPLLTVLFSFLMPISLAAQFVSLLSLYGIFYFTNRTLKGLYSNHEYSKYYLLISLLFAPYLLRNGVQVMSDLLATFCFIASVAYALEFQKNIQAKSLVYCGLFAFYGAFTRYGVLIPLFPVFLMVSVVFVKNFKRVYLIALFPPLVLGAIHFYFDGGGTEITQHHFIEEWSFTNYFRRTFTSNNQFNLASFTYLFPNVLYYFGLFLYPGFFLLNAVLLILSIKGLKAWFNPLFFVVTTALLINSLFLSGVSFQGDRYLFPTYPLFLLLLYPAFATLLDRFSSRKKLILGVLIGLQIVLSLRAVYPSFSRNVLEKEIVNELSLMQDKTLYCFEMDLALQQRGLNFNYENLWYKEYDTFEKGSLVLFNESKFEQRYVGKPPMVNWKKLKESYHLKIIRKFESGWEIYQIEK